MFPPPDEPVSNGSRFPIGSEDDIGHGMQKYACLLFFLSFSSDETEQRPC